MISCCPDQERFGTRANVTASSWNVAAVNNNPFEYWVFSPDPSYDKLMLGVEDFICDNSKDELVEMIFSEKMFLELVDELSEMEVDSSDKFKNCWYSDYKNRKAIRGFLKDKTIGEKRLASMPDRITNTINLRDGSFCTRPTAISAYKGGSLASIENWWSQWKKFIFHTEVTVFGSETQIQTVSKLLSPIPRSKYPAISIEEQEISIQLQLLCLAILDAIFIHILNCVGSGIWEGVRESLCDSLVYNKAFKTCRIISESYHNSDIFFIQEAAAIFVHQALANQGLSDKFCILSPSNIDGKRDQNSLILVDRANFVGDTWVDVTQEVVESLDGVYVAAGDLLVVSLQDVHGRLWLLASFHGDSNGLSTKPVMEAICELGRSTYADHLLLVGMDANTHSVAPSKFHHGVDGFTDYLRDKGLMSLWGHPVDPGLRTTCSCRTYLQTQLNKATPMSERSSLRHQSLKDWIIASRHQMEAFHDVGRDNTGSRRFIDGQVLPSMDFPSDHAIVSTTARLAAAMIGRPQSVPVMMEAPSFRESVVTLRRPRHQSVIGGPSHANQKTLYDYWGVSEKPLATAQWAAEQVDLPFVALENEDAPQERLVDDMCEQLYRRLATSPRGCDLDYLYREMANSTDRSVWILFSPRAASMVLSKRWFQLVVAIAAQGFLVEFALNSWAVGSFPTVRTSAMRFTARELRGGGPLLSAGNGSFSLSAIGVRYVGGGLASAVPGDRAQVVVNLTRARVVDGWFLATGGDEAGRDPVKYDWEVWDEVGGWSEVRYPPWIPRRRVQGAPLARGTVKTLELAPGILWVVNLCVMRLVVAVGFLMAAASAAALRVDRAILILSTVYHSYAVVALAHTVSCVFKAEEDGPELAVAYALLLLSLLLFGSLAYCQKYQVDIFMMATLLVFVYHYIEFSQNFILNGWDWLFWIVLVSNTMTPMLVALGLVITRSWTWAWVSHKLVSQDREAFNTAWASVLVREADIKAIGNIKTLCRARAVVEGTRILRQCHRPQPMSVRREQDSVEHFFQCFPCTLWTSQALDTSIVKRLPVISLDQLYDQAACVDIFLREKVKALGKVSRGFFIVKTMGSSRGVVRFESWASYLGTFRQRKANIIKVRWCKLKNPNRALEKLIRSYDFEVSRLLDCCRQSIYFDDAEALYECLAAIVADKDIIIHRIKNRMNDEENSSYSDNVGFRNIIINLSIDTNDTRRLGVETHVCELQLTLKCFAVLLNDDLHGRYLILRNCRDAPYFWRMLLSQSIACFRKMIFSDHPRLQEPHDLSSISVQANASTTTFLRRISHSLEDQAKQVIEEQCLVAMTSSASRKRGAAEEKNRLVEQAVAHAAAGCVWDTCHPYAAALCKPWIPALLGLLLAMVFWDIIVSGLVAVADNEVRGRQFRFVALERRDGSWPIVSPGISALGLLRLAVHDDLHGSHPANISVAYNTYTVSFENPVSMNGWWFETGEGPAGGDPVRFRLERAVDDDGTAWEQVGSSGALWTWSGSLAWTDGRHETSAARWEREVFHTGVPWVWTASHVACDACYFAMTSLVMWASLTRRPMRGISIVSATLIAAHLAHLAQFAFCMAAGQMPMAVSAAIFAFMELGYPIVFAYREAYIRHHFALSGLGFSGSVILHHLCLTGDPYKIFSPLFGLGLNNQGIYMGPPLVFIWLSSFWLRYRSQVHSRAIVAGDWRQYDTTWASVLLREEGRSEVSRLSTRARELGGVLPPQPRQRVQSAAHCERRTSTAGRQMDSATSFSQQLVTVVELDQVVPVENLDQLFVQAAVVDIFFRDLVRRWGLATRGKAMVAANDGGRSFVLWSKLAADPEMLARVEWARLKTVQRATEKVYRSYSCEVSRLFDICRQCLYFDTTGELLDCLEVIAADPEARLRRVVNKMRPDYSAVDTVGYRDVLLNLEVATAETKRLLVDTHVCELQLVLVDFARIKTDAGHARYVMWRNQRGT